MTQQIVPFLNYFTQYFRKVLWTTRWLITNQAKFQRNVKQQICAFCWYDMMHCEGSYSCNPLFLSFFLYDGTIKRVTADRVQKNLNSNSFPSLPTVSDKIETAKMCYAFQIQIRNNIHCSFQFYQLQQGESTQSERRSAIKVRTETHEIRLQATNLLNNSTERKSIYMQLLNLAISLAQSQALTSFTQTTLDLAIFFLGVSKYMDSPMLVFPSRNHRWRHLDNA